MLESFGFDKKHPERNQTNSQHKQQMIQQKQHRTDSQQLIALLHFARCRPVNPQQQEQKRDNGKKADPSAKNHHAANTDQSDGNQTVPFIHFAPPKSFAEQNYFVSIILSFAE
ncbi:hypothetical protein D3C81_1953600 [compost metagenome]